MRASIRADALQPEGIFDMQSTDINRRAARAPSAFSAPASHLAQALNGKAGLRKSSESLFFRSAMALAVGLLAGVGVQAQTAAPLACASTTTLFVVGDDDMGSTGVWASATSLQSALATAKADTDLSHCYELRLKQGVYRPVKVADAANVTDAERGVAFNIDRPLQLKGGYTGASETDRVIDPVNTVLSGDLDKNDLPMVNGTAKATDIQGKNSFRIMQMGGDFLTAGQTDPTPGNGVYVSKSGDSRYTLLEGLSFIAGDADGPSSASSAAGLLCNGVGIDAVCSPHVSQIAFMGNRASSAAGGFMAVAFEGGVSSPQFDDVSFVGNLAKTGGGGFVGLYNADKVFGGTLSPTFTRVTFQENFASGGGGGMHLELTGDTHAVTLTDVEFVNNSTDGFAGAASILTTAASSSDVKMQAMLSNVTFRGNSASSLASGLLLAAQSSFGTTTQSIVDAQLNNVTFFGNTSTTGAAFANYTVGKATLTTDLKNGTFNANVADGRNVVAGSAIQLTRSSTDSTNKLNLDSSILWGNTTEGGATGSSIGYSGEPASVLVSNSIVQGSGGSAAWDTTLGTDKGGNLDLDPKLGPLQNNGGFTSTMLLGVGSKALDALDCAAAASPATDQRGFQRPQPTGGQCDMGAVEMRNASNLLTVAASGGGRVNTNVASSAAPAGQPVQQCVTSCTASYVFNEAQAPAPTVTLVAELTAPNQVFLGWSGDACSGSTATTCTVTMDTARSVSAKFGGTAAAGTTPSGTATLDISGTSCVFEGTPVFSPAPANGGPVGGYTYPYGQVAFTASRCPSGGTLDVSLTLPTDAPANAVLFKLVGGNWVKWNGTISGKSVRFAVKDSNNASANDAATTGDNDPTPGVIDDPVLIAVPAPVVALSATPVPTLSQWALMLLSSVLAGCAALGLRRKQQRLG